MSGTLEDEVRQLRKQVSELAAMIEGAPSREPRLKALPFTEYTGKAVTAVDEPPGLSDVYVWGFNQASSGAANPYGWHDTEQLIEDVRFVESVAAGGLCTVKRRRDGQWHGFSAPSTAKGFYAQAVKNWHPGTGAVDFVTAQQIIDTGPTVLSGTDIRVQIPRGHGEAANVVTNDVIFVLEAREAKGGLQFIAGGSYTSAKPGTIRMWYDATTPTGWALCNGVDNIEANGGTGIDLRNRFPVGAGNAYLLGEEDGATTHNHDADTTALTDNTGVHVALKTLDDANHLPPYHGVYFMERLDNSEP